MRNSHSPLYRATFLALGALAGGVASYAQPSIPGSVNPRSSGQTTTTPGDNPAANTDKLAVSPGSSHLTASETQFVHEALVNGRKEVAKGHLGMNKGGSEEVKSLSQRLVNDHSMANTTLETIARANGITVADRDGGAAAAHGSLLSNPGVASNPSVHGDMDTRLSGLIGVEFDRAFAKQIADDHERAVAQFEMTQKDITDTELRGFIAATLPTLKQHLEQARALAAK